MVSAAAKLENTHSASANRGRPTVRNFSNRNYSRSQSAFAVLVTLVTKLVRPKAISALTACLLALQSCLAWAQVAHAANPVPATPAIALFRHLREAGLDAARVYRVRDAAFDREDLHFSLNDGWLIAGEAVSGRVTAALFVGDGEVLLIPPDQGERSSLALFTGAAVLEEKFTTAYFRFFDARFLEELSPGLRQESNPDLVQQSAAVMKDLSQSDALRLLLAYVNTPSTGASNERYLHARLSGAVHGLFDVFYDETAAEQISAGQIAHAQGGATYYNLWTSFASRSHRQRGPSPPPAHASSFRINATLRPPDSLDGDVEVELAVSRPNTRGLIFELSRYLKVSRITWNGRPVEFLQNEALEGSSVARKGNDVVAVILPRAPAPNESIKLDFSYSGSVLSDAGGGLLYVGARGTWYPNLGLDMANVDLEFRYPPEWTLVATGKRTSLETVTGEQVSHWVSERPIPVAGFNLGHYQESAVRAGKVEVESYAARGVERSFAAPSRTVTESAPTLRRPDQRVQVRVPAPVPKPAGEVVAGEAAEAIGYLSPRIGAFPYSTLALTQMPGPDSQGWPGLVFLSSYVFVPAQERPAIAAGDFNQILFDTLMARHETAHQWWGDSVYWPTYRDQWLSEALANYSAMLSFESDRPKDFRAVLNYYRTTLAKNNPEGKPNHDAGPVTLGYRLNSSPFPQGYDLICYGRGTWLVHMLREFIRDGSGGSDDSFFSILRGLQRDFAGKQMSTRDLQQAFERVLPKSLYYEGKPSLEWFFDGWVNGTAMPRYELSGVHIANKGGAFYATAKLSQKDAPDELVTAVPVYAELGKGNLHFVARVFADGPETSISLKVPAGTRKLVIDPHETILRAP